MDTKPEAEAVKKLRELAESRYQRRLKVLARKCGWERAKLWRILTGEQEAKLAEMMTLCAVLGVSLSHLLHSVGA
ncbi:MAG: helix-turn-helix transcriptional regulator [bacterium]|nr:helix-turn-helix transcriptional regulator [bacterium]